MSAVHSAKDLPSEPNEWIGNLRDAAARKCRGCFGREECGISRHGRKGRHDCDRKCATAIRLRWVRPDLKIEDLRGNVPTRLRKLAESSWEGIILARAGLNRLAVTRPMANFNFA